jgi:hypothetical protein
MSNEVKGGMMMRLYRWSFQKFPKVVDCQPIKLVEVFEQGGWRIIKNESSFFWGLPVRIILAKIS